MKQLTYSQLLHRLDKIKTEFMQEHETATRHFLLKRAMNIHEIISRIDINIGRRTVSFYI